MYHYNGWCFLWTLSAIIGSHVCLRQVRAAPIWNTLADDKVTHQAPCCPPLWLLENLSAQVSLSDLPGRQQI